MFAVIFEVRPRAESSEAYLHFAGLLRPELVKIDGFVANERYRSRRRDGWLVSLSLWRDEKSLIRWRTHGLHAEVQGKGRAEVFADYHLRVGEIAVDGTLSPDELAGQRFDTTEIGTAKFASLTEHPLSELREPRSAVDWDLFDNIVRPGEGLLLASWPDLATARAGIESAPGHHRIVRIIRDYGMADRREAPQYRPPVPLIRG
jgi:heme-degrading monooxygenase HmoA